MIREKEKETKEYGTGQAYSNVLTRMEVRHIQMS
jgi:hypothetical protein